uniref:Tyrosine-protein kinase n=1 Tax=Angiostrongylus cantonensis TaxID=6313 RepID=A0A0K0DNI2_ANGCA
MKGIGGEDEKVHSASDIDSGFDKGDERVLKELSFYHGFLPREDLIFLLRYVGEFLLRLSEVKNIIIHRQSGKYMLENTHAFNSLCDLINYYKKKPCPFFGAEFMLQHPIRPQSWEYHHSDIRPGKILGEGAYGMVRAGTLRQKNGKTIKVAIKQSKCHSEMGKAKIKEMMNEARLMRLLKVGGILVEYERKAMELSISPVICSTRISSIYMEWQLLNIQSLSFWSW